MATNKKDEKALAPKAAETALAVASVMDEMQQDMGAQFNFRDVIIPRIQLVQAMSPVAQNEQAKPGDLFDTGLNETIGNVREKDKKTITVYPLQLYRYWVEKELVDGEMKYKTAYPWTPGNADLEWDILEGDKKVGVREETVVITVVRDSEIDNLDESPRIISFRKTSLKGVRVLKNHFLMCISGKKEVPFQTAFEISGTLNTNEKKQSWYALDAIKREKCDDATVQKLLGFYQRYGKLIKEKIVGALAVEESEVAPVKTVDAEGGRAEF